MADSTKKPLNFADALRLKPPVVPTPESTEPVVYQGSDVVNMSTTTTKRGKPQAESRVYHASKPQRDRHKRPDEVVFSARVRVELASKIRKLSHSENLTINDLLEKIVNHYFETVVNHASNHVVNKSGRHDDMMRFSTHEDIIKAYEGVVNHKWTRRDDRVGIRYNETDLKLIEIALITTVEKKLRGNTSKLPIKSFNYFVWEIEELMRQQVQGELPRNLDDYHRYVMQSWEKRVRPLRDEKWLDSRLKP